MNEVRHEVPSSDGVTVAAWSALPAAPAGVVVLCHGLATGADDGGGFLPLRDRLLARKLAVVRFDARCHGETGSEWRNLSLRGWADDVRAVMALARGLVDAPVFVLAASFSAGPALAALETEGDCAGLVLWGPAIDYPRTFLTGEVWGGAQIAATAGSSGLPDWAAYEIPWNGVPISVELETEMRADTSAERLGGLAVPAVVFQGRGDRFIPWRAVRDAAAENPAVCLRLLPLTGHGFRGMAGYVRSRSVAWLSNLDR
jgi:alpha-beta hydrolase superfamily lysophospholipase